MGRSALINNSKNRKETARFFFLKYKHKGKCTCFSFHPSPHVLTLSFSNPARNKHPNTSTGLDYPIQHALGVKSSDQPKPAAGKKKLSTTQLGHNNGMSSVKRQTTDRNQPGSRNQSSTVPFASAVRHFKNSSTYSVTRTFPRPFVF